MKDSLYTQDIASVLGYWLMFYAVVVAPGWKYNRDGLLLADLSSYRDANLLQSFLPWRSFIFTSLVVFLHDRHITSLLLSWFSSESRYARADMSSQILLRQSWCSMSTVSFISETWGSVYLLVHRGVKPGVFSGDCCRLFSSLCSLFSALIRSSTYLLYLKLCFFYLSEHGLRHVSF